MGRSEHLCWFTIQELSYTIPFRCPASDVEESDSLSGIPPCPCRPNETEWKNHHIRYMEMCITMAAHNVCTL